MNDPLRKALDAMALEIIGKANMEGVKLADRVDVFKAVTTYHAGLLGRKNKKPDATLPDPLGFAAMKRRIHGATLNGNTDEREIPDSSDGGSA